MSDLVTLAAVYAIGAHDAVGQVRKYTGEPYWTHPQAVAELISDHGFDDNVIAAAWLHDVVEDTQITLAQIEENFGFLITGFVSDVTDISKPEDGNRKVRKRIDLEHLAKASYEGKSIKLADMIHNSETIMAHDPNFAHVYMREKKDLLEQALYDGHPDLLNKAWEIVNNYYSNNAGVA